jgi:hypothetical protein
MERFRESDSHLANRQPDFRQQVVARKKAMNEDRGSRLLEQAVEQLATRRLDYPVIEDLLAQRKRRTSMLRLQAFEASAASSCASVSVAASIIQKNLPQLQVARSVDVLMLMLMLCVLQRVTQLVACLPCESDTDQMT